MVVPFRLLIITHLGLLSTAISDNAFYAYTDANVKIFATQNVRPNWPVIFAAIPQNTSTIAANATYQWVFENNNLCTNQALEASNCTNQVVDHTFQTLGAQNVQLLISGLSPISFIVSTISAPIIPAVRREVRDHDSNQWDLYVSGLYVLKNLKIIEHLASIHAKSITTDVHGDRGAAHGGPSFLPWHRTLCRVMELNLQTAMNNSVFGIPYWAWDADKTGNNLKSSIVLTAQYYGTPAWAEFGNRLVDGPFCITDSASCTSPKTWTIPLAMEGPSLHRNYTSDRSTAVSTTAEIIALMKEQTVFDSAPFSPADSKSFRAAVEGWMYKKYGEVHNGVHDWIGGTMGKVAWSLYDPLFFAHHTQMDRIWYEWQHAKNCVDYRNGCYAPLDNDPTMGANVPGAVYTNGTWMLPGHHWSSPMYPWGLAPKDTATIALNNAMSRYLAPGAAYVDGGVPSINSTNTFFASASNNTSAATADPAAVAANLTTPATPSSSAESKGISSMVVAISGIIMLQLMN